MGRLPSDRQGQTSDTANALLTTRCHDGNCIALVCPHCRTSTPYARCQPMTPRAPGRHRSCAHFLPLAGVALAAAAVVRPLPPLARFWRSLISLQHTRAGGLPAPVPEVSHTVCSRTGEQLAGNTERTASARLTHSHAPCSDWQPQVRTGVAPDCELTGLGPHVRRLVPLLLDLLRTRAGRVSDRQVSGDRRQGSVGGPVKQSAGAGHTPPAHPVGSPGSPGAPPESRPR